MIPSGQRARYKDKGLSESWAHVLWLITFFLIGCGCREDEYWSLQEAREVLWSYVNEKCLVPENNRKAVRLDEYLAINVMGKKTFYGEDIDKKDLSEKYFFTSSFLISFSLIKINL